MCRESELTDLWEFDFVGLDSVFAVEKWVTPPCKQHIHDDSSGPNIHALGVLLLKRHFRGHEYECPAMLVECCEWHVVILGTETEIRKLDSGQVIRVADEYVIYVWGWILSETIYQA